MGALSVLARDALDTVERIRGDARHLRELGGRARLAARFAQAEVKRRVDGAIGKIADGVLEIERRYGVKL